MKPAPFTYEAPATIGEALASLAARGDAAKIIAGGQSLAPMLNMRLAQPGHLIDINQLAELKGVRVDGDRLVAGALVRHAELARDPLVLRHVPMLAHAAASIGHYAIRQRGTLGGSLAHADPAAQLPLMMVMLDAELEVASARGRRLVPASAFFTSIFTTALEPDELLTAVRIPLPQDKGWGFRLFTRRAGDFALVLVACSLAYANGSVGKIRLGVSGIGPVPVRLERAIPPGSGDAAWVARAADAVAAAADIEEEGRLSAEFRRDLVAACTRGAVADAMERAR
jgi:carbon-monoxide dehydrogenase medium subunit